MDAGSIPAASTKIFYFNYLARLARNADRATPPSGSCSNGHACLPCAPLPSSPCPGVAALSVKSAGPCSRQWPSGRSKIGAAGNGGCAD